MSGKYAFGEFEVDRAAATLLRDGEIVPLTPKTFGLLLHLLEHAGALVSREELFERHWRGRVVTDDALTRCIHELRNALDDDPRRPRYLVTMHRRGYRFISQVKVDSPIDSSESAAQTERLYGRSTLMNSLTSAITVANRERRGLVITLTGEPGVGKTQVMRELARIGESKGMHVVTAFAAEGAGAPPFWLWIQVIASLHSQEPGEPLESLIARLRSNPHTVAAEMLPTALSREHFDLRQQVVRHLCRIAGRTPLLLLFEDLHAAEPDCLQLLCDLVQQTSELPVLVTLSYRDVGTPPNAALRDALAELARSANRLERMALRGLDETAVEQWFRAELDMPAAATWARVALEKTAGNPLYLRELIQLVAANGNGTRIDAASAPGDEPPVPDAWAADMPETVHRLLQRRLALLDRDTLAVLRAAATIGKQFSVDLLQRSQQRDEREVRAALHAARNQRLLHDERGRWSFAHGLVREVLYEDMPSLERAALHLAVSRALEHSVATADAVSYAQIAWHYGLAEREQDWATQLARFLMLAAAQAFDAFAYQEAAAHCERLTAHRERHLREDAVGLATAFVRRAQAVALGGRPEQGRALAAHALTLASSTNDPTAIAIATLADTALQPSYPPQPALVSRLSDVARNLPERQLSLHARLLAQRAFLHYVQSNMDELRRDARAAEQVARKSGDREAIEDALSMLSYSLIEPQDDRERRAVYEERLAMARRANDLRAEYAAQYSRLEHVLQIGPTAADIDIEVAQFERLVQRIDSPGPRAALLRVQSGVVGVRGDPERALQIAREAVRIGEQTTDLGTVHAFRLLHYGAWPGWLGRHPETFGDVQQDTIIRHNSLMRVSQPYVLWRLGYRERATELLDAMAAAQLDIPRDMTYALSLSNLAMTCLGLAHCEVAQLGYAHLLPFRGRNVTALCYFSGGCASQFLAFFAAALGNWEECAQLLEEALEVNGRLELRLHAADTAYCYARVLEKLGKLDKATDTRLRCVYESLEANGVRVANMPGALLFG